MVANASVKKKANLSSCPLSHKPAALQTGDERLFLQYSDKFKAKRLQSAQTKSTFPAEMASTQRCGGKLASLKRKVALSSGWPISVPRALLN